MGGWELQLVLWLGFLKVYWSVRCFVGIVVGTAEGFVDGTVDGYPDGFTAGCCVDGGTIVPATTMGHL